VTRVSSKGAPAATPDDIGVGQQSQSGAERKEPGQLPGAKQPDRTTDREIEQQPWNQQDLRRGMREREGEDEQSSTQPRRSPRIVVREQAGQHERDEQGAEGVNLGDEGEMPQLRNQAQRACSTSRDDRTYAKHGEDRHRDEAGQDGEVRRQQVRPERHRPPRNDANEGGIEHRVQRVARRMGGAKHQAQVVELRGVNREVVAGAALHGTPVHH
jgi:hypothetical protein